MYMKVELKALIARWREAAKGCDARTDVIDGARLMLETCANDLARTIGEPTEPRQGRMQDE